MNIREIDIDHLIQKAVEEKCEITINCNPENIEIRIEPWKPFEYKRPYKNDASIPTCQAYD